MPQLLLAVLFALAFLLPATDACFSSSREKRRLPETSDQLDASAEVEGEEKPATVHSALTFLRGSTPSTSREERIENATATGHKAAPLTDKFVAAYLREYKYIRHFPNTVPTVLSGEELSSGIKRFQRFAGIMPATGQLDAATASAMMKKRCENADFAANDGLTPIWERSTLKYSIEGISASGLGVELSERDVRELVRQAFSAWEIVISLDFAEIPPPGNASEQADIAFVFVDDDDEVSQPKWPSEPGDEAIYEEGVIKTGMGVSSATPPTHSQIVLAARERWSTFQVQEEANKLDIFLVLIHQIGHALGMGHSPDKQSVMYPLFEREVGEQLPVISSDDVDRLRALYSPVDHSDIHDDRPAATDESDDPEMLRGHVTQYPFTANATALSTAGSDWDSLAQHQTGDEQQGPSKKQRRCPRKLTAATQVASTGDIFIFDKERVWRFDRDRNGFTGPHSIGQVFPDSPSSVDVAITVGIFPSLTVLIHERVMFGYEWDLTNGTFKSAYGFPQPLHNRVLFYPEAGFSLANGSVVLVKDDVFATLDLVENVPLMLNDKCVFFPGLPKALRAGLLESPDTERTYYMLTETEVYVYDMAMRKSKISVPLAEFLRCDEQ